MVAEEMHESIETLRRRITEVEELKNKGFPYREVLKGRAERQIRVSVGDIFGKDSAEFQQYGHLRIDLTNTATIDTASAVLHHLIQTLEGRFRDLFGGTHVGAGQSGAIDALTGLHGRSSFDDFLMKELSRCERRAYQVALMRFTVLDFTETRQAYGADVSNNILLAFASAAKVAVRRYDYVCRIGVDEFAIILPDCDTNGAYAASRRIGHVFAENIGQLDACPTMKLSFGVASFPGNGKSPEVLFDAALPKESFYDGQEEVKAERRAVFSLAGCGKNKLDETDAPPTQSREPSKRLLKEVEAHHGGPLWAPADAATAWSLMARPRRGCGSGPGCRPPPRR